jgi:biopolymer transport protein ExbD
MLSAYAQLQGLLSRRLFCYVALSLAVGVASCTASPPSVAVKLEISEAGTYLLDGQVVQPTALVEALRAARLPGNELVVYVAPTQKTNYEAVRFAMAAVQQAGGSIGMVGNERF